MRAVFVEVLQNGQLRLVVPVQDVVEHGLKDGPALRLVQEDAGQQQDFSSGIRFSARCRHSSLIGFAMEATR